MLKRLGGFVAAIIRNLQSRKGQVASGFAALAALTWLLWPVEHWRFEPEPAVAFLTALFVWLGSHSGPRLELAEPAPPSAHDIALLGRLRSVFTEQFRSFLRDQDFGSPFRTASLNPLFDVADTWRGEPYEFDDGLLQAQFVDLLEEVRQLSTKLATWTGPIRNPDFSSSIPERERELDDPSERTWSRIRELNERATTVTEALDDFLRNARRKLET